MQDLEAAEEHVVALEEEAKALRAENESLHQMVDHAHSSRARQTRQLQTYRRLSTGKPASPPGRGALWSGGGGGYPGGQSKGLAKFATAGKAILGVTRFGRFREAGNTLDNATTVAADDGDIDPFEVLREQAADLEQEVVQLQELQKVLSKANVDLSDDCIARSASLLDMQRQLARSEELLVPYISGVQQLKQSASQQQQRIEGLEATVAHEVRLRRQLARLGQLAYRALGDSEGHVAVAAGGLAVSAGLARRAMEAMEAMEATAPLGPHKSAPLATQLQLLIDLAAHEVLPLAAASCYNSRVPSGQRRADATTLLQSSAFRVNSAETQVVEQGAAAARGSRDASPGVRRGGRRLPQTVSLWSKETHAEGGASPHKSSSREVSLPTLEVRSSPNTAAGAWQAGPAHHSANSLPIASPSGGLGGFGSSPKPNRSPARRQLKYPTG